MIEQLEFSNRRTPVELLRGCLLHSLGQGLYGAITGQINWMRWWDGWVYRIDNGSGDIAAVAFDVTQESLAIAGAIFNHSSERSPWRPDHTNPGVEWFLSGAPRRVVDAMGSFILPYVSDQSLPKGATMATCVFWSDGDRMVSNDSPDILNIDLENVMEIETANLAKATLMIESGYGIPHELAEMSADVALLKSQSPGTPLTLSVDIVRSIEHHQDMFDDTGDAVSLRSARHSRWMNEFRQLIAPIGLIIPEE